MTFIKFQILKNIFNRKNIIKKTVDHKNFQKMIAIIIFQILDNQNFNNLDMLLDIEN